VVRLAQAQHALAGRACYEQGLLYLRLGKVGDAQAAFRAVVRDFPLQTAVAALARARLPVERQEIAMRRVWSGEEADPHGRVSPDGRFLSFVDWNTGDLAIRTLHSGENRRVTRKGKSWANSSAGALESVFSPDGRHLAYSWLDEQGHLEIRITGVDGAGTRTLVHFERRLPAVTVADWSPDGKHVLAIAGWRQPYQELLLIRVADGAQSVIPCAGRFRRDAQALFSPDGKYIAYDVLEASPGTNLDIRLVQLAGLRDAPVVEHPAKDLLVAWSPDSSKLIFASDRSGSPGLWAAAAGAGQSAPVLVKADTQWIHSNGMTRLGSLYYSVAANISEIYLGEIDSASAMVAAPPKPLSQRHVDSKGSMLWSPDGKSLLYVPSNSRGAASMVIRTLPGLKEQDLYPEVSEVHLLLKWLPHGQSIYAVGTTREGGSGILRIDLNSGGAEVVSPPLKDRPSFSADASTMYFGEDQQRLVARDLRTGAQRVLYTTDVPKALRNPNVSVSPDGSMIAFQLQNVPPGYDSLLVMPLSGGEPRRLVSIQPPESFLAISFVWTNDSRHLLMSRLRDDRSTVWKIPVAGGPPEPIGLSMPGLVRMLRLNPDGRGLAFLNGELKDEIWTMENVFPAAGKRP
jgi:Tol biopolymer transport system component